MMENPVNCAIHKQSRPDVTKDYNILASLQQKKPLTLTVKNLKMMSLIIL